MEKGFYYLDQYKKIRIKNEYYNILGYAELKEGEDFWKKFRIMAEDGSTFWLHVYEAYEKDACKMYAELIPLPGEPLKTIYSDKHFSEIEEGKATVIKIRGIKDLNVYDEVYYLDYENEFNVGELLSYERWNNKLNFEYSKGHYIFKGDISFTAGRSFKSEFVELTSSIDMFFEITLGKTLIINDNQYIVSGIVSYNTKNRRWNEYYLRGALSTDWLYLEKKENSYLAIFGRPVAFPISSLGQDETYFKGRVLELNERETAYVIDVKGDVDLPVDVFISYMYQSFTGEMNLVAKQFSKGRLAFLGKFMSVRDIIISSKDEVEIRSTKNIRLLVLFVIFLILFAIYMGMSSNNNNTIASYMVNNIEYSIADSFVVSNPDEYKFFMAENESRYMLKNKISSVLNGRKTSFTLHQFNIDKKDDTESDYLLITKKEVIIIYKSAVDSKTFLFVDDLKDFDETTFLINCHDKDLINKVKDIVN